MSSKKKLIVGLCSAGGALALIAAAVLYIRQVFKSLDDLNLDFDDDDFCLM